MCAQRVFVFFFFCSNAASCDFVVQLSCTTERRWSSTTPGQHSMAWHGWVKKGQGYQPWARTSSYSRILLTGGGGGGGIHSIGTNIIHLIRRLREGCLAKKQHHHHHHHQHQQRKRELHGSPRLPIFQLILYHCCVINTMIPPCRCCFKV